MDTDACDVAVGSVLQQVQGGVDRVLGYYSKALNSAQRNYCTTKKELLAIVATFNHWDVYLSCVSEPFVLRTDHAALTWLRTMACRDKAMLRWCDAVNKYNFVIQHRSGVKHQNADALSRARLVRCGWDLCGDCKELTTPFADEDEILTRHNEELIIPRAVSAAPRQGSDGGRNAASSPVEVAVVTRSRKKLAPAESQANICPPRRSARVADKLAESATPLTPKLPALTQNLPDKKPGNVKSPRLGKKHYAERQLALKPGRSDTAAAGQNEQTAQRLSDPIPMVDPSAAAAASTKVPAMPRSYEPLKAKEQPEEILADNAALKGQAEADILADQDKMSCQDWVKAQTADPAIRRTREILREFGKVTPNKNQLISEMAEVKALCQHWRLLEIIRGVVTRVVGNLAGFKTYARLVPVTMRTELFKRVHGYDTGHFGYAKIYPLFVERFFWHGMSTDIQSWLKCCELCQRIKPKQGKGKFTLHQEIAGAPMERCGVDLSGPWPESKAGNFYLCVIQDYFSKWIEVFAIPNKTAISVAKCLVNFMARYGRVHKLHSDLGMEFKAEISQNLYELWSVKKTHTCPYTPWSDGMVERSNRTIKQLLKVFCEERLNVWDEYIWCIMQAYNSTVHVSTGFTPFMLMHSRCENPDLPFDALYTSRRQDLDQRNVQCKSQYLVDQKEQLLAIHELVRKHLQASAEMQQRGQIQGGMKMEEFKTGQKVWWYYPPSANQKLKYPWTGPYEIIDVALPRNIARIKGFKRDSWVHASSLKLVVTMADGKLL